MQRRIVLGVAAVWLASAPAFAQQFRGSLSGRVLDQQQAVVPGAKIHAVESETGAKFQTVTNADGTYVLPFLPPGPYSVTAEAAGFKRYVNTKVRVTTNEREQIDIHARGRHDRSIRDGIGRGSMLETASSSTGQVINQRQIENMPINGRAPLALAQLAFGVTPNSDPKFSRPFDNSGPSGFSMGGAPEPEQRTADRRLARYHAQPARRLQSAARRGAGNQGRDLPDRRRLRAHRRRHGQRRDARRHQLGPRQRLRVQPGFQTGRHSVVHQPRRPEEIAAHLQPVGHDGGRPDLDSQRSSTARTSCSGSSATKAFTTLSRNRRPKPWPPRPSAAAISRSF